MERGANEIVSVVAEDGRTFVIYAFQDIQHLPHWNDKTQRVGVGPKEYIAHGDGKKYRAVLIDSTTFQIPELNLVVKRTV